MGFGYFLLTVPSCVPLSENGVMNKILPWCVNVLVASAALQAATVPYQGLATDAKGNPKVDATYGVVFALYPSATAVSALWVENQTVATHKGLFSASLGTLTVLPDSLFNGSPLYLGVSFAGGAEGGRALLGTTPWAKAAGKADSARAAHWADSAKAVVGLGDSLASVRAKTKADSVVLTVALTKNVSDSIKSLRDSLANLRVALAIQGQLVSSLSSWLNPSIPWNSAITYGTLTDSRDGQLYRTVVIGSQTWMAQNLNYGGMNLSVGVCYNGSLDSCSKYGRLYNWKEVMAGGFSSSASPSGVKGLCLSGWHVPSAAEWTKLSDTTLSYSTSATSIKSSIGWSGGTGTDIVGFRALPGGWFDGVSHAAGGTAGWWSTTATQASPNLVRAPGMISVGTALSYDATSIDLSLALRCVKD